MENRLATTQEFTAFDKPLPDNVFVIAFKMVNFGPETMAAAECNCIKICEIAEKQPSFFIISESPDGIRQSMHDLVDRFCNMRENKHESEKK